MTRNWGGADSPVARFAFPSGPKHSMLLLRIERLDEQRFWRVPQAFVVDVGR